MLLLWEHSDRWLAALRRELRGDSIPATIRAIASADEARTQLRLATATLLVIELSPERWTEQAALIAELPSLWPAARVIACVAPPIPAELHQWLDELGVLTLFTSTLQIKPLAGLARRWHAAATKNRPESRTCSLLPQLDLPLPPIPIAGQ